MADTIHDSSMMTFGEHIEELRIHIIRAAVGLLLALLICMAFGDQVVRLIVSPAEYYLRDWHVARIQERTEAFSKQQNTLPPEQRETMTLEAKLDGKALSALAKAIDPKSAVEIPESERVTLELRFDAASVVRGLSMPMTEINPPWSIRTLAAQEALMIYFKASLGAGFVLASPWIFYQLYSFVAVGLYAHERRFVMYTLPFSVGLFLIGVFFCYVVLFPFMLQFLFGANRWMGLQPDIRLTEWVGFAVMILLVFGLAFQLPLILVTLERVGVLTYEQLESKRRIAYFGITVGAALVMPGDVLSMLFLTIPMCLLFELGLFLMWYFHRANSFAAETSMEEELEAEFADVKKFA